MTAGRINQILFSPQVLPTVLGCSALWWSNPQLGGGVHTTTDGSSDCAWCCHQHTLLLQSQQISQMTCLGSALWVRTQQVFHDSGSAWGSRLWPTAIHIHTAVVCSGHTRRCACGWSVPLGRSSLPGSCLLFGVGSAIMRHDDITTFRAALASGRPAVLALVISLLWSTTSHALADNPLATAAPHRVLCWVLPAQRGLEVWPPSESTQVSGDSNWVLQSHHSQPGVLLW